MQKNWPALEGFEPPTSASEARRSIQLKLEAELILYTVYNKINEKKYIKYICS